MLRRIPILLGCCLLLSAFMFGEEPEAAIQGFVFAEGKPLQDATVVLLNESGDVPRTTTELPTEPRFVASAVTDVTGMFLFFKAPNAKMSLHVSKPGFLPYEEYVEFYGRPVTLRITVKPGKISFGKVPPRVSAVTENIFYATDRRPSGESDPQTFFANERSRDGMHYGEAIVSVPSLQAQPITMEEALGVGSDRVYHVVLVSVKDKPRDAFLSELESAGKGQDALVFIHGYSNSFEYAARRLGALKHDLNFSGLAILYSWASRNSWSAYPEDEATADWSSPHFQKFLQELFQTGIRRVHFIAHSMGNRILLRGLQACNLQHVGQAVFAAPDVDADTFREALLMVKRLTDRMTEYANDDDRALWASAMLHRLPRAGQLKAAVYNSDEDVVDATRVDTSLDHHSYFVDSPQVVSDISLVIAAKIPPRPHLIPAHQNGLNYWQLQR